MAVAPTPVPGIALRLTSCASAGDAVRAVAEPCEVRLELIPDDPAVESLVPASIGSSAPCICGHDRPAESRNGRDETNRAEAMSAEQPEMNLAHPTLARLAAAWPILPPHIRDAIQTLIDAGLALSSTPVREIRKPNPGSNGRPSHEQLVRRLARQCRGVIQNCLGEEEWQDAESEFFDIIAEGTRSLAAGGPHADIAGIPK